MNLEQGAPLQDDPAHDDLLLQRYVDGELSEAEEQQLLLRGESSPQLWRRLALTLIEHRLWDAQIPSNSEWDDSHSADNGSAMATPKTALTLKRGLQWTAWIGSLAAMMLFGVVVGRSLVRDRGADDSVQTQVARDASSPTHGGDDYVLLTVDSPAGGASQTVRVPIFTAVDQESLGQYLEPENLLREDVVRGLRQRGYEFQHQREIVPYELPDGRRVIVPVDNLRVQHVGYRGFQ